jgi:hypothetical protein
MNNTVETSLLATPQLINDETDVTKEDESKSTSADHDSLNLIEKSISSVIPIAAINDEQTIMPLKDEIISNNDMGELVHEMIVPDTNTVAVSTFPVENIRTILTDDVQTKSSEIHQQGQQTAAATGLSDIMSSFTPSAMHSKLLTSTSSNQQNDSTSDNIGTMSSSENEDIGDSQRSTIMFSQDSSVQMSTSIVTDDIPDVENNDANKHSIDGFIEPVILAGVAAASPIIMHLMSTSNVLPNETEQTEHQFQASVSKSMVVSSNSRIILFTFFIDIKC